MIRESMRGVALAFRHWRRLLPLAVMTTFASVLLSLIASDLTTQTAVLKGSAALREHRAVAFTPYYPPGAPSILTDSTLGPLLEDIDDGSAYTAILANPGLENPALADRGRLLVVSGGAVGRLFPELHVCSPAPCAQYGPEFQGPKEAQVRYAGLDIPVRQDIPSNATWFDPSAAGLRLGGHLIINLPARALLDTRVEVREEALTRAILLDDSESKVDLLVAGAASDGLYLVPRDLSGHGPDGYADLVAMAASYIAGVGAFGGLVLLAIYWSTWAIARSEARGTRIRMACGAGRRHVVARTGALVGAILLPSVAIVLMGAALLGGTFAQASLAVAMGLGVVFVAEWVLAYMSLARAAEG
jgi:hypothetical protein